MTVTKLVRIQQAYFQWLMKQVQDYEAYLGLLAIMHHMEFVWLIPNDDNRIVDGTDLRIEFLNEIHKREDWTREHFGPCSVLEVLIGLSRRLSFAVDEEPEVWAYRLLKNLDLAQMRDPLSRRQLELCNALIDQLIWRKYGKDGKGGFFPLRNPPEDQTRVEIWYQMAAYINERHPEF